MDEYNILKNEKYNVGNISKQRINITTKTKGKPLDQGDIKKIVRIMKSISAIKRKNRKYL